jgi:hypothetical protein
MATFITEDGRRVPFIDWASVSNVQPFDVKALQMEPVVLEEPDQPCPACIAANDLLDRELLAFIQV